VFVGYHGTFLDISANVLDYFMLKWCRFSIHSQRCCLKIKQSHI